MMNALRQHTIVWTRQAIVVVAIAALAGLVTLGISPRAAAEGPAREEVGVGYFYGTFDQSPNVVLLAGGTAEEFCDDNPNDPFNGEPGSATGRTFFRADGSVDIKVNDANQPIYLYYVDFDGAPPWIESVCADYFAGGPTPEPFAAGTARLKVRLSILGEGHLEIFNSVRGQATADDGSRYLVTGSADLVIENGIPVGNPADFVDFSLKELGR